MIFKVRTHEDVAAAYRIEADSEEDVRELFRRTEEEGSLLPNEVEQIEYMAFSLRVINIEAAK